MNKRKIATVLLFLFIYPDISLSAEEDRFRRWPGNICLMTLSKIQEYIPTMTAEKLAELRIRIKCTN